MSARSSSSAAAASTRSSSTTAPTRRPAPARSSRGSSARQTAPDGTEVGAVGGLGTSLTAIDPNTHAVSTGPGRIEFEDVEALTVKLGTQPNTFTVGGDSLFSQLPQARQQQVFFFDQSPAVMTTITGGMSSDTFQVVSTVALDRTAFDASDGLITVSASSTACTQHIDVRDGKIDGENHFTLTYTTSDRHDETTGVLLVHRDGRRRPGRAARRSPASPA